jgi:hypothetical protein
MLRRSQLSAPLAAADMDNVIQEVLGTRLLDRGFEQVRRRSWVRSSTAPIRHEVGVGALKGYSLVPGWSLSLDFVSHVTKTGRIAWHRSAKQHYSDLGVDPLDYADRYDVDRLVIPGMRSLAQFRKATQCSAELTIRYAEEWFEPIQDLTALVVAFERAEAAHSPRFGFDNYVQHRLAYAFFLAEAGEHERATAELDLWCDKHAESERIVADLHRLLEAGGDWDFAGLQSAGQ